ncbi:redoxin family protein [Reichenbachiella sp.]|uniref:TlpA family protein disulfide reductase n=1 Tax=Reichenbachiella sp. TaxID=2184521 RepID=UPI0032987CB6
MSVKLKILSIITIVLFTISCQPTAQIDYALISGKVTNAKGISYVTVKGDDFSYDIDLNSDGTFSDTLRIQRGYYRFFSGRERTGLFLDQGYDLNLEIDQSQFDETLTFTSDGKGTKINNYLANKARLDEKLTVDFQTLFSKEETPFIETLSDWKSKMSELLKSAEINDTQFAKVESRSVTYEYLTQFANYEYYHQYATKNSSYKAPEEFKQYLADIDLNNEEDFNSLGSYKSLLQSYFGAMIERGEVKEAFAAIKGIESSVIKMGLVPDYIYKVQPGNEHAEAIYQGIISITSDSAAVASLTEKIEKIRKLQTGMSSAPFAYQNIDGETVSLADLKGKYIYVDVWATWCGPCLREIPALKQLETDYHEAPVEFVSISIDAIKDFQKWQEMVAEKELKGVQLFADNSWQSDFVKAYAIDGIPRFIVIDPEGKIIDPNAPRPSDPEIRVLFEGLEAQS